MDKIDFVELNKLFLAKKGKYQYSKCALRVMDEVINNLHDYYERTKPYGSSYYEYNDLQLMLSKQLDDYKSNTLSNKKIIMPEKVILACKSIVHFYYKSPFSFRRRKKNDLRELCI